jgi:hypothetical protein
MITNPFITQQRQTGPSAPSLDYHEMAERWALPYDLYGGTIKMRARGKVWLPQEMRESDESYKNRLRRTFLYNAFRRTIKAYVGVAFLRNVTVNGLPTELEYLINDCDGTGRSLTAFTANLCEDLLISGKGHILVDNPNVTGPVTLADVREQRIRPYFNSIDPRNLIAWKVTDYSGLEKIQQMRFVERSVENIDEWQEQVVERIRAIEPGFWRVYKLNENNYDVENEGSFDLEYVPIVNIYAKKEAPFVAYPPLEDLAWLNLRHWQSSSDQNNILHVVRVPLMFGRGFQEGELDGLEIGANRAVTTTNENADLRYVEHTGNAINAGRQDLKDLEERMGQMGSDILIQRSVSRQTAAARKIDQAESMSIFQVILRNLESAIEQSIKIAGEWIGVDATNVQVIVGDDLSAATFPNPVDDLLKMNLTLEAQLKEMKRRGMVSDSIKEEDFKPEVDEDENQTMPELPQ